jgi:hypothetical protein
MCRIAFVCKWNFSRGDTGGAEAPPATHLRAPPPPSPPRRRLSGRRTSVRPQGRRRRGPTSLLFSSLPMRLFRMVFLIHGTGSCPRPASSGSALGVAGSAPWGSRSAPWGLGVPASAVGDGSGAWLAALAGCGAGAWRRLSRLAGPPSWLCGVCLASSRGAKSTRRTSGGGQPDPRRPFSPKSVVS